MEDIQVLETSILTDSKYINPKRVTFKQNGKVKTWDYYRQHDSVAILIYDVKLKSVVLVKQFRPAVYMTKLEERNERKQTTPLEASEGVTYELCAGIIDRKEPPSHIASAEVWEETGYKISPEKLEFITKYRSVGVSGATQYLYYVEVDPSMRTSEGGGIAEEGELIDLHMIPLTQVVQFTNDTSIENRPAGALFALTWFIHGKMKNFL